MALRDTVSSSNSDSLFTFLPTASCIAFALLHKKT